MSSRSSYYKSRPRDKRAWPLIHAAIKKGWGKYLTVSGIEGREIAEEMKRSIYRAAQHHQVSASVACRRGDEFRTWKVADGYPDPEEDGTYTLKYAVWEKKTGQKAVVAMQGTDRSKWDYDPHKRDVAPSVEQILAS